MAATGGKRPKPGLRPKPGGNYKPGMTRLRTVWITAPSQNKFEDDYSIIKAIGEPGQFGKAYQVKRNEDKRVLAVKEISKARIYRLHPSDTIRQSLLKSMQAEIDIMRRLKHRYIVNMYSTYETKHTLRIVMEECKGGELFDRIKARRRYKENDAKPIVKMMCEALFYMHDEHRVVHCDLKPDNILFVNEKEDSDIKIIDFGMSKVLPRLSSLRELCGTPYYTAPEVIHGNYSHAADMWSVGVIAYVMIFGFPPFYVDPNKYYGTEETKQIYKLIVKGFDPNVKKGYGAWFPKALANKLSKDGMDFMAGLMEKNVGKRLTAKEALQHPWLKGDTVNQTESKPGPASPQITSQTDKESAQTFANFATSHKFKFAITAIFRDQYEQMRPKHFENLRVMFNDMDKDGNGKISYEEFEQGMLTAPDLKLDRNKIKAMFAELDLDKSGEIVFENFLNAAVHDYLVASDVRLYQAFRDLDEDESGKIKIDVLKQKIQEMNPYGNVDILLQIVDDVDANHDGTIDYEEFLRALHPDFNETPNWFWSDGGSKNDDDDDAKNADKDDPEELDLNYNDEKVDTETKKFAKQLSEAQPAIKDGGDTIIHRGYMHKEGKMIKSWKKRWFTLHQNGLMAYYYDEDEVQPISRFNCKHITNLVPKAFSAKKKFGIKIYTPHRNWKFLCDDETSRNEWVQAFERVKTGNKM